MRIALVAWLLLAVAGDAAGDTVTERAQRLFEEGRALKDKGDDEEACKRFEESYQLVAAAGTGFNLAECMEREGKYLRAWQLFTAVATEWERDDKDKRASKARARAVALERKLVRIVVDVAEPDLERLTITIGDRRVPAAPQIREVLDPGEIEITASAPGHLPYSKKKRFNAGANPRITIPVLAQIGDPDDDTVETHLRRSSVVLAIGLGAIGAGGMVAGGALFVSARDLKADGRDDEAERRADISTAIGGGGIALAIACVIVIYTAPRDVTIAPVATSQSAGLAIGGRF